MQDVHWSEGAFGYFPSYLLGNIYDGMLLDVIEENVGSINELLKSGHIKDITDFLIDKIYVYGGAYNSKEVIKRLTGKEISAKPIIKYFENKYNK
jgi:carboxypeptidase Taq